MKKSTIYTQTGDAGETSLVGGVRVPKNGDLAPVVEAILDGSVFRTE